MKKISKLLHIIILLLCIVPLKINAININSDYYLYSTSKHILDLKDIDVSFNFFTGSQIYQGNERVYISGSFNNPNYLEELIYTKTLFLDENKKLIAVCDSEDNLLGEGYSNISYYCGVDEVDFSDNKKIEDIKYYKVLISVNDPIMEEEVVVYDSNSNIYNENSEIISDGITNNSVNNENTVDNNGYNDNFINSEYYLNSYDINIIVNEDNTFNINEKIGAFFNVPKHGIFRKIPIFNNIERLDGSTTTKSAKISDIKVSDKYSTPYESGYEVIKIGDPNRTLTGQKDYEINYLYKLERDKDEDYDELYFNLIGDEWDTSISNITFTIIMPKEFDSSKLGFSSGKKGSVDSSKINYIVSGNKISGEYNGTLNAGEALTVRLELPKGYFIYKVNYFGDFLAINLSLLFIFITYKKWKKYGKDEQVIETVEFYPPEGFNSAEVAFLYKGYVENKDVVSLLIYLANEGYIKIIETEEKSLFSKSKGFKIVKQKEYDGNNVNEALFLKGLFMPKFNFFQELKLAFKKTNEDSNLNYLTEVTAKDLYNNFYKVLDKIRSNIHAEKNQEKIFEKSSLGKGSSIIVMIIVTLLLSIVRLYFKSDFGFPIFPLLLFNIIPIGIIILTETLSPIRTIFVKVFGSLVTLVLYIIPWICMGKLYIIMNFLYFSVFIVGYISILIMILLCKLMPKRTKYGNEMLGKIRGFKNFLETVEKEKLEALVMEYPTYFYDILPYTYVLDVSDKWIKKFETISLKEPDWYDGYTSFDSISFGSFINSTMSSATSAMSSSPSSSSSSGGGSSGGSSGGGSSGGGSGGGGGGSW